MSKENKEEVKDQKDEGVKNTAPDNKDPKSKEKPAKTDENVKDEESVEDTESEKEVEPEVEETEDKQPEVDTKRLPTENNFSLEAPSMSSTSNAVKFLALAITAYANKQYEDAGALFVQAAECSDHKQLVSALLEPISGDAPDSQQPIGIENQQQLSSEDTPEDDAWGDENEGSDQEDDSGAEEGSESSESSGSGVQIRRRVTSIHQIGKILAASMEATASETEGDEDEDEDEDESNLEADPDLPGEELVPVSFSSFSLKPLITSPIKLKS